VSKHNPFPGSRATPRTLSQPCVNAKAFGGLAKPLISGPQKSGGIDQDGRDQVWVNQANAQAIQTTGLMVRRTSTPE
jgi:hypothetical protein